MGLLLAMIGALSLWIVLWAVGLSTVDDSMMVIAVVLVAAALRRLRLLLVGEPPATP